MSDHQLAQLRGRNIGFVFQKFNLLPTLTARDNIEVARHIHGVVGDGNDHNLADIAELLRIQDKIDRKPAELSGGEQQRVAIARALANNPRVILADEPTGNLDTANSERAFELLQNIVQKGGNALLLATHNPVIAEACDWIHEMKDGRIVASHPRGTRSSIS